MHHPGWFLLMFGETLAPARLVWLVAALTLGSADRGGGDDVR